jgi:capsular polysaccharide biosynthesis protein
MNGKTYDDEIDLRPYIQLILQKVRQIGLFAVLVAVLALIFSLLQQRQYQATAMVLLTRSRPQLSLTQQFPTVNDPADLRARTDAALELTTSSALVFDLLKFSEPYISSSAAANVDVFREKLDVRTKGDLLLLSVTADDPEAAEKIANYWAELTVNSINAAYAEQQPVAEILVQLNQARETYSQAQANLENFLQSDNTSVLEAQVDVTRSLVNQMALQQTGLVQYYVQRSLEIQTLGDQARSLKAQLEAQDGSLAGQAGDALAVLQARATFFALRPFVLPVIDQPVGSETIAERSTAGRTNSPYVTNTSYSYIQLPREALSMQIPLNELTVLAENSENMAADLDILIQLADQEVSRIEEVLVALTQEEATSPSAAFTQVSGHMQTLQVELESQKARKLELTTQRDLALNVYKTLTEKETEVRQQVQTARYANLASPATTPTEPLPRGTVRNTLIGGVLGVLLAVFWILVMQWWRNTPAAIAQDPVHQPNI